MQLTTLSPQIANHNSFLHEDASGGTSELNSRHQLRLMESAGKAEGDIRDAKFDLKAIFSGDTISDFGKTDAGKALLTSQSEDSDLLISTLQGKLNNKSGKLISTILSELFGDQHNTLINPNLSTDEVRAQFNNDPRLVSAFHELPGYIFLIKDFEADEITWKDFKQIMLVNLGHNGPNEGFWKMFYGMINSNLEEKGTSIHLGTPFADSEGLMTYPQPQSPEGFAHAAVDRMDQAIDGLPKLAKEVSSFQDIAEVHSNLLTTCQTWTLEQMRSLKTYLPKLMENFKGDEIEKQQKTKFLNKLVDRVSDQIMKFRDFIGSRLTWTNNDDKQELEFRHDDGMIEKLSKDQDGRYSHSMALHQPSDRQDFMNRSATKFLGRIVQGFNEGERYTQAS